MIRKMTKGIKRKKTNAKPAVRCAIYTRKSSNEGLEQDFNSLDAQREACEAFILSQKQEGWIALPEMYDDGGISGGTIDRPALKRLLADIEAHRVDAVVIYKVDRLTRALSDFAKIVAVFDKHGVSFVSVTQQFNTTTSIGRLTLNMLLSFAQFEREVTGERIRDKIAASKKKGMWMGGNPPLGFDCKDRNLVVNEIEAKTVRHIFRRYLEVESVRLLKDQLHADGVISKLRRASDGSTYGGKPLARGALYLMLQNRIYRGEIVHKDKSYPGLHQAIVDQKLWDEVQAVLARNRVAREAGGDANQPGLLAGLLHDARGQPMTPTHAIKKGKRYRYYVSRPLLAERAGATCGQRLPAASLEPLIVERIRVLLADPGTLLDALQGHLKSVAMQRQLIDRAGQIAKSLPELSGQDLKVFIQRIASRIQVHNDRVEITVDPVGLLVLLSGFQGNTATADLKGMAPIVLTVEARLKRTGIEKRMVLGNGLEAATADPSLLRIIARAHSIRARLFDDTTLSLKEIAKEEDVVGSYVTRLLRLSFLAPDIVAAILKGEQPPELTASRLAKSKNLPLDWTEQRKVLGFT